MAWTDYVGDSDNWDADFGSGLDDTPERERPPEERRLDLIDAILRYSFLRRAARGEISQIGQSKERQDRCAEAS